MTQKTEITLRIDRPGQVPDRTQPRYLLTVSGQPKAGARPDVVQIAVCTLVQSVGCYLAGCDWQVLDDFDLEGVPGSGWCSLMAVPTEEGGRQVDGAFRLTAAGFELLERQFPQRVQFRLKEPALRAPRRTAERPAAAESHEPGAA